MKSCVVLLVAMSLVGTWTSVSAAVYKIVNGKRAQLGSAEATAPEGKWHTLRVVHRGDQIRCYLNGKLHLDVKDATFPDAGKVGLWTKADAQTRFADFQVSAAQP